HRRAGFFDCLGFFDQCERIENDAAADHACRVRMEDAGRNQMQHMTLTAEDDRVACVVAALIARDDVEVSGKDIDDLALALVSPLQADDCEILLHNQAMCLSIACEILLLSTSPTICSFT